MIRAVIFDFDGLIIDTETVWFECYREALTEYGIELPLKVFGQCVGSHGTTLYQYIGERLPGNINVDGIRKHAKELFHGKIANVSLRQGVMTYLEEAQRAGLHIGLASSSDNEWVEGFLNQFQIRHYFEVMKTSNDVKEVKPDPELYLKAIEALQVQADEVVAFEDSANGAKAAKEAGIHCVVVPNPVTTECEFERYDLWIDSMDCVPLKEIVSHLEG